MITDFSVSLWLTVDVNSARGCLHRVDVGSVGDVSEVHGLQSEASKYFRNVGKTVYLHTVYLNAELTSIVF